MGSEMCIRDRAGTDLKNWLSMNAKPKNGAITIIRNNFDRRIKYIISFSGFFISYVKGICKGRSYF